MTPVELRTSRLRLRDFELGDYQAVHAFAADLAVVRHVEWGPNTPQETQAFLQEASASAGVSPRRRYALAVVVQADGEMLIGSIELQVVSFEHHRGEIGYVLARESWGHGYATEATGRLLAFGFNELGLHKISATCDPENRASVAVLTKNGMRQEGVLRDHIYVRGAVARPTLAQRHRLIGEERGAAPSDRPFCENLVRMAIRLRSTAAHRLAMHRAARSVDIGRWQMAVRLSWCASASSRSSIWPRSTTRVRGESDEITEYVAPTDEENAMGIVSRDFSRPRRDSSRQLPPDLRHRRWECKSKRLRYL